MNKLSLTQLSEKNLDKIQQKIVRGGCLDTDADADGCCCCSCGCNYEDARSILSKGITHFNQPI